MNSTTTLGQVVDVSAGQPAPKPNEFSEEGYPFIRAGSLQSLLNGGSEQDCEKIDQELAEKKRFRLYPKDTILFAKSGMSAKIGRVYRLDEPSFVVSHLAALAPTGKYDPNYLTYWLRKNPPSKLIKDDAYPSIRISDIANLEVPDLELDEQRRIAALLDKAEAIRRKREQALALADDFLRALFLDMFGDPVTNPKGWDEVKLGRYLDFVTSGSRGWAKYYSTKGARFIRSLDVQMNEISSVDEVYVTPPSNQEAERSSVKPGDVLLTITGSRIGRVACVPQNFGIGHISQHVAILRLNPSLDPRFLTYFMCLSNGGQRQIKKLQYGQTKPGLNLTQIREFKILDIPLIKQHRFISVSQAVTDLKAKIRHELNETDALARALSQRAFRGEL